MQQMITEALMVIIKALVPVLVAFAIQWLRKKIGEERLAQLKWQLELKQDLAIVAVKFAEQAFKDYKGPQKYVEASHYLAARAQEIGLTITDDEIRGLIEWALREIKDQLGNEWANIVALE